MLGNVMGKLHNGWRWQENMQMYGSHKKGGCLPLGYVPAAYIAYFSLRS